MPRVTETTIRSLLTRSTGYLDGVASHSAQPYRGCAFGNALCGVGCYARHNGFITRGRRWGSFLEVRTNAADAYISQFHSEQRWARRQPMGRFIIFCASVTDPFVPQEKQFHVTRSLLDAMIVHPPDGLILQTHSPTIVQECNRIAQLSRQCDVRVHISIESDRDRLPGLPPPTSSVRKRLAACRSLRAAGIRTIVTVAPLLPIRDPRVFFQEIAGAADAVIIDHFIGGDGSNAGSRTWKTPLPQAMAAVDPASVTLDYRDQMVAIAREIMPGHVGIGQSGFAGQFS